MKVRTWNVNVVPMWIDFPPRPQFSAPGGFERGFCHSAMPEAVASGRAAARRRRCNMPATRACRTLFFRGNKVVDLSVAHASNSHGSRRKPKGLPRYLGRTSTAVLESQPWESGRRKATTVDLDQTRVLTPVDSSVSVSMSRDLEFHLGTVNRRWVGWVR